MYGDDELTLKNLTTRLVRLASQINLMVYYAKPEEVDIPKVRSYLKELEILTKVMEARLER